MVIFIAVSAATPVTIVSRAPVTPLTTTTSPPDFAELLGPDEAKVASLEHESDLMEEALSTATSTTTTTTIEPSTTTTTAPAQKTTTTAGAPATTSPPTTSPPTTSPPTTAGGGYSSGAEGDFASKINGYRSSNGQPNLARDGSLDGFARESARRMGEQASLSHANIGALLPPWSAVGENIGAGGEVGAIFSALAASSGHSSTMLDSYTHYGVGVWVDGNGTLWTSQVFAR
jgi:uncharacterized protein YkwD